MIRKSLLLTVLVAVLSASPAWALEELIKNYRGIRSLGMGGLVTTTGRYDEALFANPATQMEDADSKLTILALTGEVNTHLLSDLSKINTAKSAGGTGTITTLADKGLVGTDEHARVTLLVPAYYNPHLFGDNTGFAFGLLINNQTNLLLHQDAVVDAQQIVDIGPSFGFGQKLLDGALDVGINVHVIYRLAGDPNLRATNFLTGQKLGISDLAGQGIGVDGDVGALYKLPLAVPFTKKISIGASFNNVAQSTYRIAGNNLIKKITTTPPGNDRTVAVGGRVDFPDVAVLSDNLIAVEFQDIGTTRRLASTWKKLHMGAETHLFAKFFSVRAGFNQGYATGGVGFDLPLLKIDLATYGEEVGSNTGQYEDRRVALRLSFDI